MKNNWQNIYSAMLEQMRHESAIKEYNEMGMVYRLFHKAPKNPNDMATVELLCKDYVDAYNEEHKMYIENVAGAFSAFYMRWNNNTNLPVLIIKTFGAGCYGIERKAFDTDGTFEDWGCPYPYSECGISYRMELQYVPEGSAELYAKYDEQVREIANFLKSINKSK